MADDINQHAEWLSLIEVSGSFLVEPILKIALPQGLEKLDPAKKKLFRQTYDEWRESLDDENQIDSPKIHQEWVKWVIKRGLEWDEDETGDILKHGDQVPADIELSLPEYDIVLRPEYAVYDNTPGKPYLLFTSYPSNTILENVLAGDSWSASPVERMVQLCRSVGTRLAIITNGEQWMFIDAPDGGVATYASWYARLWGQEPVTLQAFLSLFNISSIFNGFAESKRLTDLLDDSLTFQDDVTETLGEQVGRAVEVLVQSIDRINNDYSGKLLESVKPTELYEASLTIMMRLVFLLCAEERDLLLLGDETYEANYALSTLRLKLREEAGQHGEEVLSYRKNAWARLLAIFRAVYAGVDHENMRMPALGGSLFDPDRFPFLEGRAKGSRWDIDEANPLPIDNRTVLLFLDAIQLYKGRTLSYRALDVEQIGYVYEGLLEKTVVRAPDVTLELSGSKTSKKPWVYLEELLAAETKDVTALENLLKERTGSATTRIDNDLAKEVADADAEKLLFACNNDIELRDKVKPYFHFLRLDAWGSPLLYPKGAFMVTTGNDRRETGTHYTPKSLTEAIVKETLEPIVYIGPSDGIERENWQLKKPAELLAIKTCDPAMGSGAFLVQVCRYLSERLCESWLAAESSGKKITIDGEVVDALSTQELMPLDAEERLMLARRLVAEHCLYGVDINPLAVELAKLAIWLVTLSKGRPFGFLDHNLRSGNSLLGVHDLNQLYYLNMQADGSVSGAKSGKQLFAQGIEGAVKEAISLREQIRERPVRDIHDVQVMTQLNEQAQALLETPELIADALIGEALVCASKPAKLNDALTRLSVTAGAVLDNRSEAVKSLEQKAKKNLTTDVESGIPRKPFHWPLAFPEVFNESNGFDVIVGNVPFLGGQRLTGAMGTVFRDYLVEFIAKSKKGSADLAAYFFLQLYQLLRDGGCFGLLATNTISEGDTRQVGLEKILSDLKGTIFAAYPSQMWPGKAAVVTSRVHIKKGSWTGGVRLNNQSVDYISAFLSNRDEWSPKSLESNLGHAFQGSITLGEGFILSEDEALGMIQADAGNSDVLFPYINGKDLNTHPNQKPSRWVINFFDWPEGKAMLYAEPYKRLLEKVKPERQFRKPNGEFKVTKTRAENWWKHASPAPALYHSIGRGYSFEKHPKDWDKSSVPLNQVLVSCIVTKHLTFSFVPNSYIYANTINVFALNRYADFSVLQSSIHAVFVWKHASRMKSDLRYTPTDVFQPFPNPEIQDRKKLDDLGQIYHDFRRQIMSASQKGLTQLYNRFHDPKDKDDSILKMRALHKQIDEEVALAYGWDDLELGHDFHEVDYLPENDRIRYTLSEKARGEVLDRLTLLNKERYAQVQASKPSKPKSQPKAKPKTSARSTKATFIDSAKVQMSFFDEPTEFELTQSAKPKQVSKLAPKAADLIYDWLEVNPLWHTKEEILRASGANPAEWDAAVADLLDDKFIERKVIESITHYRFLE